MTGFSPAIIRPRDMGACRRVRECTCSSNSTRASGRGRKNLPWKVKPKNSNPPATALTPDLGLSHFQPDVGGHFSNKGVSGLSFKTGASEDHEVIGLANEPETGLFNHDIEAMEVGVGKEGGSPRLGAKAMPQARTCSSAGAIDTMIDTDSPRTNAS
jgi:hypothetical protein